MLFMQLIKNRLMKNYLRRFGDIQTRLKMRIYHA